MRSEIVGEVFVDAEVDEPSFAVPCLAGLEVGQAIDDIEVVVFFGELLEHVEVEDILGAAAAEEEPDGFLGDVLQDGQDEVLHGRHARSAADAYQLNVGVGVELEFSVGPGDGDFIADFEVVEVG